VENGKWKAKTVTVIESGKWKVKYINRKETEA
jgi:hypothetical protein